jgi:hypothetical protein
MLGGVFSLLGMVPIVRFLVYYFRGDGGGHVQPRALGGVLLKMGIVPLVAGVIADLLAPNRQPIERLLQRVRRLELANSGGVLPVSPGRERADG